MNRLLGVIVVLTILTAPAFAQQSDPSRPLPEAHMPKPAPIWFTFDDYPPAAAVQHWQGLVRFRLTLGTDGRVRDCEILQSSGHDVLDEQTCALLRRRAKFEPPLDEAGRPLESQFVSTTRWLLPPGAVKPPEPLRTLDIRMLDGKPSCSVDWDGIPRELPRESCRKLVSKLPESISFPVSLKISVTAQELGLQ